MDDDLQVLVKKWCGTRYKKWQVGMGELKQVYEPPSQPEMHAMMLELGISIRPKRNVRDARVCAFCRVTGDMQADGPGRCV